jgi:hypothetical protein
MTDRAHDDDDFELPELDLPVLGDTDAEDVEGVEDEAPIDIRIVDDGEDPFDDSYADDVPIDVEIQTDQNEPSALGEIALGIETTNEAHDDDGIRIEEGEGGESMIDEGRGHAEEGLDFVGDDELGIDPIPTEVNDGGLEGLDDPGGEEIDEGDFPPLDGNEDDDEEELDLGLELEPPPPSDEG